MLCHRGRTRFLRLGIPLALAVIATPASGQVSPWCDRFNHGLRDHQLKSIAMQVRDQPTAAPDAELLERFKLATVLKAILVRAGSSQTPADLLGTMVESIRAQAGEERQPKSGLRMRIDGRPGEAALTADSLLADTGNNSLKPIGFFNRFDQTSLEGRHCGEARVVYSKPNAGGRLLIIFEAKVTPKADPRTPGTLPPLTERDCRPVAEFWASLIEKSGPDRAAALADFFFQGKMIGSAQLDVPPLSLENLGGTNRGQVRGNMFVNGDWQLREWQLRKHVDRLAFDVTTVKDNPLAEFYDVAKVASMLEPARGRAELTDFQTLFADQMVPQLVSNSAGGSGQRVRALAPDIQMMHSFGFGAGLTERYDEFQSTSQGNVDLFAPDSAFATRVDEARRKAGSTLTTQHIIARATALTCQGCHQPSGVTRPPGFELEIAPGIKWPPALNFVHIDEESRLSTALLDNFLPFRAALLKDHLCTKLDPSLDTLLLADVSRRTAPAPLKAGQRTQSLQDDLDVTQSAAEKAALQEAINAEQLMLRRAERSLPGTLWPFRRTH